MSYDAFNAYKQNSVMTASPEELTLMLYEGAVKFMNIAKEKIKNKDIENAHNNIIRAQDIITELNVTLDMQYPISHDFRSLYTFIDEKLIDANITKNLDSLEDAIKITVEMRDLWKEIIKVNREAQLKAK